METLIADIMSSPDPLHESPPGPVVPSSRRITRSQVSRRVFALPAEKTPRKQTFELDVGDKKSPQKILVTVEAENRGDDNDGRDPTGVSRKLFQSPSVSKSARRAKAKTTLTAGTTGTTTTIVPVRGLSDDEDGAVGHVAATPQRRRRPPRSATPAAGARKRTGTPIRKTPRPRKSKAGDESAAETTADDQATPRPRRRATPGSRARCTKRKDPPAAKPSTSDGTPRKRRGRPRKQDAGSEDTASSKGDTSNHDDDEMEKDIGLANMSELPRPEAKHSLSRGAEHSENEGQDEATGDDASGEEVDMVLEGADEYGDDASPASESHSHTDQEMVAAGEEFTMISIGSLPSMQPRSSMMQPAQDDEFGETTSLIISQTLESLRQSRRNNEEQVGGETGDQSEKETKARWQEISLVSTTTSTASPDKSARRSRRGQSQEPLSQTLARKQLHAGLGAFTRGQDGPVSQSQREDEDVTGVCGEDSFSDIPEAVLAAATPKAVHIDQAPAEQVHEKEEDEEEDEEEEEEEEEEELDQEQHVVQPSTVHQPSSPLVSSRMLTPPDETSPTPTAIAPSDGPVRNTSPAIAIASVEVSDIESPPSVQHQSPREDTSRPPPFRRHRRTHSTETPLDQVSPAEGPPGPGSNHLDAPAHLERPTLSPIVRAGRALQLVTSDPPSPRERESVLGSPFRRSGPKSSQSPAQHASLTHPNGAPDPVAAAAEADLSPSQPVGPPQPQLQQERSWADALSPLKLIKDLVAHGAQRLSPRAPRSGLPITRAKTEPALEAGEQTKTVDDVLRGMPRGRTASVSSSARADIASNDGYEMAWEAEGSPGPAPRYEETLAVTGSSMLANRHSPLADDGDVHMSEDTDQMGTEDVEAETPPVSDAGSKDGAEDHDGFNEREATEEDIWAIEASRPTPSPKKAKQEAPRQSALPGPRRRDRQRPEEVEEEEEYSLLSQLRRSRLQAASQAAPSAVPPTKRMFGDLSSFFSSPAVAPDTQPSGFGLLSALSAQPRAGELHAERQRQTALGSSRNEKGGRPSSRSQMAFQLGNPDHFDIFSPVRRGEPPAAPAVAEPLQDTPNHRSSPPAARDHPSVAPIPQKRNFTPRLRRPARAGLSTNPWLFSRPTPTLPGAVLDDEDEQEDEEHGHAGGEDDQSDTATIPDPALEQDEGTFRAPSLRPLPDRAMSPTKSCLRSPLKPKTPGRVVDFDGDAMSPLTQARARVVRRRASMSSGANKGASARVSPEEERLGRRAPDPPVITAPVAAQVPISSRVPRLCSFGTSTGLGSLGRKTASAGSSLFTRSGEEDKENERLGGGEEPTDAAAPAAASSAPSSQPRRSLLATSTNALPTKATAAAAAAATPRHHLSPTQWSKDHWVRLDQLLQERRQSSGPLPFQLRHPGAVALRKTADGRRALLGKQVTSVQGGGAESMVLEAWHLDVVDAFRAEVGGWDEAVLARRLFALMLGEERRRAGLVPLRR